MRIDRMNARRAAVLLAISCFSVPAFAQSCGDVLVASTTLTHDLHCSGPGPALAVAASSVTISLGGWTITGGGSDGISVMDRTRVTIRGPGRIESTGVGVRAVRVDELVVSNVEFYAAAATGVDLVNSRRARVQGNRFYGDGILGAVRVRQPFGTFTAGVATHTIVDNVFDTVDEAIVVCGADSGGNTISGNSFEGTSSSVRIVDEADRNVIANNKFRRHAGTIFLTSNQNVIRGNVFEGNGNGVSLQGIGWGECARRRFDSKAFGNRIEMNKFYAVPYPILAGDHSDPVAGSVVGTRIVGNRINDAMIGITFGDQAHYNDATGNFFVATPVPVHDTGSGNIF